MKIVTFEDIKNSEEIKAYIRKADESILALGFTEHSFTHALRCVDLASRWLLQLGYSEREAELVRIAGYMHDIGNLVNRTSHAQSGALMAFDILTRMGLPPEEVASVVTAIGHHDEQTAFPVNAITAALILADKTDVRRSRVRNKEIATFDIHDRVNYAVTKAVTLLDVDEKTFTLRLEIDPKISSTADYFEIFLARMLLCRRSAELFNLRFKLIINDSVMM